MGDWEPDDEWLLLRGGVRWSEAKRSGDL